MEKGKSKENIEINELLEKQQEFINNQNRCGLTENEENFLIEQIVKEVDELNKAKKEITESEVVIYSNVGYGKPPLKTTCKNGAKIMLPSAFGITEQAAPEQEKIIIINTLFPYKIGKLDELKIIKMTGEGYTAEQIGKTLGFSEGYIRNQRKAISEKITDNNFKIDNELVEPVALIRNFYYRYLSTIDECLKQR